MNKMVNDQSLQAGTSPHPHPCDSCTPPFVYVEADSTFLCFSSELCVAVGLRNWNPGSGSVPSRMCSPGQVSVKPRAEDLPKSELLLSTSSDFVSCKYHREPLRLQTKS